MFVESASGCTIKTQISTFAYTPRLFWKFAKLWSPRKIILLTPAENNAECVDIFDTFHKTVTFRRNHACTLGKLDFFRGFLISSKTDNFFRKSVHFCSSRVLVGVHKVPEIWLLLVPPGISKISGISAPGISRKFPEISENRKFGGKRISWGRGGKQEVISAETHLYFVKQGIPFVLGNATSAKIKMCDTQFSSVKTSTFSKIESLWEKAKLGKRWKTGGHFGRNTLALCEKRTLFSPGEKTPRKN